MSLLWQRPVASMSQRGHSAKAFPHRFEIHRRADRDCIRSLRESYHRARSIFRSLTVHHVYFCFHRFPLESALFADKADKTRSDRVLSLIAYRAYPYMFIASLYGNTCETLPKLNRRPMYIPVYRKGKREKKRKNEKKKEMLHRKF